MVLVDTSVWIELLSGRFRVSRDDLPEAAVCGPVIQEVLQGLRPGPSSDIFREVFLAIPKLCDPVGLDLFRSAADIYRQGRRRGLTIRSSVDCLVAAIAIDSGVPVWHRDRDFTAISSYTPLQVSHLPFMRK